MELLRTLDHPNIIRLFEVYIDEKHFYLIEE
jgi:serine/threonine protein kinase